MAIKVIQWATGTVGIHAAPAIAAHPDLELVGLWVLVELVELLLEQRFELNSV